MGSARPLCIANTLQPCYKCRPHTDNKRFNLGIFLRKSKIENAQFTLSFNVMTFFFSVINTLEYVCSMINYMYYKMVF